jgi:hypothetical protein
LKEASRFFYTAIDASVNRSKGAFFAFMGSLEMAALHQQLLDSTNPQKLAEKSPDATETQLAKIVRNNADATLESITEEQREPMYRNSRSLQCLKELSTFLYDRLLSSFSVDTALGGNIAPASLVKGQLVSLCNIVYSMKEPPPLPLLGTLFIFMMHGQTAKENAQAGPDAGIPVNAAADAEVRKLVEKAEKALAVIRHFNRRVPLKQIVRCATRDLGYEPVELSGGEDWFAVYRTYWKTSVAGTLREYIIAHRKDELGSELRQFLGDTDLEEVPHVKSEANPDGFDVTGALRLSFLLTFYKRVFSKELNPTLRPILIDGEFLQRDNRTEFAEGYSELIKLDDAIKTFSMKLSAAGDYGKRYDQMQQEVQAVQIRSRKMKNLLEEIDDESLRIISGAYRALDSLKKVLCGISNRGIVDTGDVSASIVAVDATGEQYDTLANLAQLAAAAGAGTQFYDGVTMCIAKISTAITLLENAGKVETESDE